MTTLERIRAEIEQIRDSWETDCYHDEADALTLALQIIDKYAEQEPTTRQSCENCKQDRKECGNDDHYGFCQNWEKAEQEPCDDVVSRQAVLDCATLITSIPTEDWDIGDWVCLFRDRVSQLPSVRPQEPKTGHFRDCISRDYLLSIANKDGAYGYVSSHDIINAPCYNPQEPKTGHWLFPYGDKRYKKCSVCGRIYYSIPHDSNYCPNCGAKMESEDKE